MERWAAGPERRRREPSSRGLTDAQLDAEIDYHIDVLGWSVADCGQEFCYATAKHIS
jgi:hypothetical protein